MNLQALGSQQGVGSQPMMFGGMQLSGEALPLEAGRQQDQAAVVPVCNLGQACCRLTLGTTTGTRLEACQYASHVLQVLMEPWLRLRTSSSTHNNRPANISSMRKLKRSISISRPPNSSSSSRLRPMHDSKRST